MPISGEMVNKIISHSNTECLEDLRNCLIVALAFSLLLRHNELSHLTLDNFVETSDAYKILIPKSKTDKYRNGSHVYLKKSSDGKSVSALLSKYLSKTNLKIGQNHFLFFPLKKVKDTYSITNKIEMFKRARRVARFIVLRMY